MHRPQVPSTLAAAFPIDDWQFWVVTALFIGAILWLARGILPWSKKRRAKKTRVTLTVGGRTPDASEPQRR